MSVTEQQGSRGRSQPEGPDRPSGRASGAVGADVHVRPVVAAGLVLLLWFAWLLLPTTPEQDRSDAPVAADTAPDGVVDGQTDGEAGEGAGDEAGDGDRARLFGDDPATAGRAGPVAPSAGAGPTDTEPTPDTADDSAAGGSDGGADDGTDDSEAAAPAPVEPEPVVVPQAGEGTFTVAPGGTDRIGGQGTLVTYAVEVEDGVPLESAEVARVVDAVLADPRSWTAQGEWTLQRTDSDPDVRLRVSSPDTTDRLCAPLRTNGELSCRNGADVVLNAVRWTQGADAWGEDVDGYREYLVNHEVGHFLGQGHETCPAPGEPAPVMLQQTLGLQGCVVNGWPYP